MLQTSIIPADSQTIARVKNWLLLLHNEFDWDKHFGADYSDFQMHALPKDVFNFITKYLLPQKLKSAIANCVFQLALDF